MACETLSTRPRVNKPRGVNYFWLRLPLCPHSVGSASYEVADPTIPANWEGPLEAEAPRDTIPMEEGLSLNITGLVNLVNTRSDKELPGPSTQATASPTIDGLQSDLTETLTQLVRIEHHNKQMSDALRNGKAPPGLTPKLNLTAMGQNEPLTKKVNAITEEAGLAIVRALQEHYQTIAGELKAKAEEIKSTMERILNEYSGNNKATLREKLVTATTKAQEEATKVANELREKRLKRKRPTPNDPEQKPPSKSAKLDNEHDEAIAQRVFSLMTEHQVQTPPHTNNTNPINTQCLNNIEQDVQQRTVPTRQGKRPRKRQGTWQAMKAHHKKTYRSKRTILRKLTKHKASDNIINLSDHILTTAEISILSKGLSFIPKPEKMDKEDILSGLTKLKSQIILKTNPIPREKTPTMITNVPDLYNPWDTINNFRTSSNNPELPKPRDQKVISLLQNLEEDIKQNILNEEQEPGDNITRAERIALENLALNEDLIINKADKGSTVVVQNKTDYVAEGLKHLCDPSIYRKLTHNTTPETKDKINELITKLDNSKLMPWQMTSFCRPPPQHRTAQLYFLKKIHKNPMGIRPIVSSVNSITENISKFIDFWLQPIVRTLPSYLKDSTTFANLILNTKVPTDCILVSIDVSSLYTNIPHTDGLEAATTALADHTEQDPIRPPIQILRELMSIVLKNNIFEFNGDYYLQLQGTAMGTKMAPSYANLFMGKLEPTLIAQDPTHIKMWKRYIDDIFIIWTGTEDQLQTFLQNINKIHPTIKFTYESDSQELTFLDMTVYKGPNFKTTNTLDIKTHIKKTNK